MGKKMVVYGPGYTSILLPGTSTGLWSYDTEKCEWNALPCDNGPPAPRAHQMMTKVDENRFWIIGGLTMNGKDPSWGNADIWEYNLESFTWKQLESIGGPGGILAALPLTINGKVYLIGGEDNNRNCSSDVWLLE